MRSNYKLIGTLLENSKEYKLYRDLRNNKVYKIYENELELVNGRDLEAALISEQVVDKITKKRKCKKSVENIKLLFYLSLFGLCTVNIYQTFNEEIKFIYEEDSFQNNLNYLKASLNKNIIIDDVNKNIMKEYINIIGKYDINEFRMIAIGQKLNSYDFKDKDLSSEDMIGVLNDILNLKDNGFVAKELYAYVNNKDVDEVTLLLANIFILERDIDFDLLNGESLENMIKNRFNVTMDINNLSAEDVEILRKINEELREVFVGELFTDSYQFNNNIFSDYITFRYDNRFDIYGTIEGSSFVECSDKVYLQKLIELLYNEGKELDYNNPDDRLLVYLYANSCLNFINSDDIASFLYEGTKYSELFPCISQENLFEYLTKGTMNYKYVVFLRELVFFEEDSLPLLQEVNLCLKKEVECGNLTQDVYDYFINGICDYLEAYNPDVYEKFIDAALKDKSIDGFKLNLLYYDNL